MEWLKFVGGSLVVAVACSASGGGSGVPSGVVADAGVEAGGYAGSGGSNIIDAAIDYVADVLVDVPDAEAAPPMVVTGKCDQRQLTTLGYDSFYAVFDFPGKTVADLASVSAVIEATPQQDVLPTGPTHRQASVHLTQGRVWVLCGYDAPNTDVAENAAVTVVLP